MLHANDMLDQRIIENKKFIPCLTVGYPIYAIREIISLVNQTKANSEIQIKFIEHPSCKRKFRFD